MRGRSSHYVARRGATRPRMPAVVSGAQPASLSVRARAIFRAEPSWRKMPAQDDGRVPGRRFGRSRSGGSRARRYWAMCADVPGARGAAARPVVLLLGKACLRATRTGASSRAARGVQRLAEVRCAPAADARVRGLRRAAGRGRLVTGVWSSRGPSSGALRHRPPAGAPRSRLDRAIGRVGAPPSGLNRVRRQQYVSETSAGAWCGAGMTSTVDGGSSAYGVALRIGAINVPPA